jgi:creatinine amidohydrolase
MPVHSPAGQFPYPDPTKNGDAMKKTDTPREVRVQYMLPHALHAEMEKLPLMFLPIGPIEWHGPHMAVGMDPINAERVALELAQRIGGVVYPTLYAGTERERDPETLKSLGFRGDEYVVGMDFPPIKNLYRSFYISEELFAQIVRGLIDCAIETGYRYIYIVNGHGAVNHNAVLKRLCTELSKTGKDVRVDFAIAFPKEHTRIGAIGHAAAHETSLLMHYHPAGIDLKQLPPRDEKLHYRDYGIVDGGGFCGQPGKNHALPAFDDPRLESSAEKGLEIFEQVVAELAADVRNCIGRTKPNSHS